MRFISFVLLIVSSFVGCNTQQMDLAPKVQSIPNKSINNINIIVSTRSDDKTYLNIHNNTSIQTQNFYYKKEIENVCFKKYVLADSSVEELVSMLKARVQQIWLALLTGTYTFGL